MGDIEQDTFKELGARWKVQRNISDNYLRPSSSLVQRGNYQVEPWLYRAACATTTRDLQDAYNGYVVKDRNLSFLQRVSSSFTREWGRLRCTYRRKITGPSSRHQPPRSTMVVPSDDISPGASPFVARLDCRRRLRLEFRCDGRVAR